MTQETPTHVRLTPKGLEVIREVQRYPESEQTEAYMAIRDGYYEQWQEDRLKILDDELLT